MFHLMRSLGSTRPIGPTICRFAAVGDGGGGCRGGGGGTGGGGDGGGAVAVAGSGGTNGR